MAFCFSLATPIYARTFSKLVFHAVDDVCGPCGPSWLTPVSGLWFLVFWSSLVENLLPQKVELGHEPVFIGLATSPIYQIHTKESTNPLLGMVWNSQIWKSRMNSSNSRIELRLNYIQNLAPASPGCAALHVRNLLQIGISCCWWCLRTMWMHLADHIVILLILVFWAPLVCHMDTNTKRSMVNECSLNCSGVQYARHMWTRVNLCLLSPNCSRPVWYFEYNWSVTQAHIRRDLWWTSAHWTREQFNVPDTREWVEYISVYWHPSSVFHPSLVFWPSLHGVFNRPSLVFSPSLYGVFNRRSLVFWPSLHGVFNRPSLIFSPSL